MCCSHPDVQLTAECTSGLAQLQWESSKPVTFGFDVIYNCNSNDTCDGGYTVMMCVTYCTFIITVLYIDFDFLILI